MLCSPISWRWLVRGTPERQMTMLTTLSPGDLIPEDHPIRQIRVVVDAVLAELDDELTAMYATTGRPSVPPEQLLKATVLMAMDSIRSERAFCERLNYDVLFKWFLDLAIDARAFDATTFSKNRQRLVDHEIADRFSRRWSAKRSCAAISRAITSRWTARCWKRGPRTRASNLKTGRPQPMPPGRNASADIAHVVAIDLTAP
jgi:transposase